MKRNLAVLTAALLLVSTAAACSNGKQDSKGSSEKSATKTAGAADRRPKKLADYYSAKLDAVSEGTVAECQTPSSTTCATDLSAIMSVVDDLEADIDSRGGAAQYPKTTQEIAKMRAAQREYKDNGCEADPAADDPNSDCWGVVYITAGSAVLSMTLPTDELS